jgi:stringent starvation protein B
MSTTQDARKKFTIATAQENLYAVNLANVIANVDTQKMGTVYNPYTTRPIAINGTAAATTSYTPKAYAADADSLQVNRRAGAAEHVDSYDWKSVDFGLLEDRGMNMGKTISQVIDGYVLSLPVDTAGVVTLGDGGVAGSTTPWTSSDSVIDNIINTSIQEIDLANSGSKRFMVVSSYEANDLRGYLQTTGNMVADEVIRNGIASQVTKVGTTFSGVDVFQSNNITQSVVLGMATNPTAGDTITFGNATVTFVATLTGAANEVHIASTVDITRANLAEWFNGLGALSEVEATDTGYSAGSTETQSLLTRLQVAATNNNGADTLTIVSRGVVKVSETLTAGSDTWAAAQRFLVFGDYGSINLYLPTAGMDYVEKEVGGKPGVELYMEQFYNAVIWTRMKDRVLAIRVN